MWWKAQRVSGEKNSVGEFHVEDGNGIEWQVQVIRKKDDTLACARPAVCVSAFYEPGETEWDIFEAVRAVLKEEKGEPS